MKFRTLTAAKAWSHAATAAIPLYRISFACK